MQLFAGRYVVERILGEGGMGRVYLVTDPLSGGRRLALKHLRSERLSPTIRAAMSREFRVLMRLRHPNLVEVHDFNLDPQCYFTMEYVRGRDLRAANLDATRLVDAVAQVCRALEYVHSRGLVHLDVKPSNIQIAEDEAGGMVVKIMDFGVASEHRSAAPSGYTLGFVAPEVVEGRPFDGRADLYSLGMTLLALKDAQSAEGSEITLVVRGVAPGSAQAPLGLAEADHLPPRLLPFVERLVRPDPTERFASAAQALAALAVAAGRDIPLETPATRVGYVHSARMTGREKELARLVAAWHEAQRGQGRRVVIAGPAGQGKSLLVRELRVQAQLEGGLVATARCREGAPTYAAVAGLVAQLAGVLNAGVAASLDEQARLPPHHVAELARLVPTVNAAGGFLVDEGDEDLDSAASRSRLTEAVMALIGLVATARQLMLVIEDAHWLDDASAQMMRVLRRRIAAGELGGLLVVETTRAAREADDDDEAVSMWLAPLGVDAVRSLVEDVVGQGAVPEAFLAAAAARSGGNGFYVAELLKLLADRDLLVKRGDAVGWTCDAEALLAARLPETLEELVAERIRLLPQPMRQALWTAAALGGPVEPMLLDEVQRGAGDEVLDLVGRLLVVADGRAFRLAHDEVRAGARRDALAGGEWGAVNARVASVLAGRGAHPAEVARAWLDSAEPARALPWLMEAGERAEGVFDYEGAVRQYDRALEVLQTDPALVQGASLRSAPHSAEPSGAPRGHVPRRSDSRPPQITPLALHLRRLGAIRRGGLGQIDPLGDRALAAARAVTPTAELDVRLLLGRIALLRGRFTDAAGDADVVLAADPARTEAYRVAGLARYNLGDLFGALARLDEAAQRFHAAGDLAGEAAALSDRGLVHGYTGAFDRAVADHRAALAILAALPHAAGDGVAAAHNNLGFASWNLGRYDDALRHLDQALALRRRLGDLHGEGVTRNNIGNVLRHRGDLEGASAAYREAIALCRRAGNVLYEAIAHNNLGQIEEELDRFDAAAALYRQALALARRLGDRIREGDNLGNLGICLLRHGSPAEARELLERSVELRRAIGDRAYLVLDLSFLAVCALALGDSAAARGAIDQALAGLAAGQEGIEQGQAVWLNAHRVLSALGDGTGAARALERAAAEVGARATAIADLTARRAFLERPRVNREIVALCGAAGLNVVPR